MMLAVLFLVIWRQHLRPPTYLKTMYWPNELTRTPSHISPPPSFACQTCGCSPTVGSPYDRKQPGDKEVRFQRRHSRTYLDPPPLRSVSMMRRSAAGFLPRLPALPNAYRLQTDKDLSAFMTKTSRPNTGALVAPFNHSSQQWSEGFSFEAYYPSRTVTTKQFSNSLLGRRDLDLTFLDIDRTRV
ncbi:hypothetical protein H4R34_003529 [Dimargaris verticillata]|uniref:Uncharacterized protein n=1 Tax=Dimargaris verticillata TaxID=2761393 RepID=A0A9W8B5X5_9FUNG|nr:hypothetical protein H4R34_003529 [Dimargaris verticillata]